MRARGHVADTAALGALAISVLASQPGGEVRALTAIAIAGTVAALASLRWPRAWLGMVASAAAAAVAASASIGGAQFNGPSVGGLSLSLARMIGVTGTLAIAVALGLWAPRDSFLRSGGRAAALGAGILSVVFTPAVAAIAGIAWYAPHPTPGRGFVGLAWALGFITSDRLFGVGAPRRSFAIAAGLFALLILFAGKNTP